MSAHNDFFRGKHPWSIIKDNVLKSYMPRYLAKVNKLGRRILLIDAYAGMGCYEDGSLGSPLIMCQQAESYVKGNYDAIFINKSRLHHKKLTATLRECADQDGWSLKTGAVRGDARQVLNELPSNLGNETVFLYLDPFGPTGAEFPVLFPFLQRNHNQSSTEIVLTLCMPAMHRFAETRKVREGRWSGRLDEGNHARLTRILNGDYWKDILWRDDLSAEEREYGLIQAYCAQISRYLPVTRYCPVRETANSRIKYFIVFASRHMDALVLMNDGMTQAYYHHMHVQNNRGSLFEPLDWRQNRSLNGFEDRLQSIIIEVAAQWPGETRKDLWIRIVDRHFGVYTETEYRQAIKLLDTQGRIRCEPDPKTKRVNDHSRVWLRVS